MNIPTALGRSLLLGAMSLGATAALADIRLYEHASFGGAHVTLRAPAHFGERTALTGQPRTRTVRVMEDAEALVVDGPMLRSVVLRNPFLAMELAKVLFDSGR